MSAVKNGLDGDTRVQRLKLFEPNLIDIAAKSTITLLVDEVYYTLSFFFRVADSERLPSQIIHPFYVFQIASIILWSIDDYYYYAFCIALISTLSVVTTLVDTKKVRHCSALVKTRLRLTALDRPSLVCVRCLDSHVLSASSSTVLVSLSHFLRIPYYLN